MLELFKNLINIETVLDALGIDYVENGDELYAICPNVNHREKKSSWSINRDVESESFGRHNCFGCGFRGNLETLAFDLLELDSIDDAEDWILSLFGIDFDLTRPSIQNRLCDVSIRKRLRRKENPFDKPRRIFLSSFERVKLGDKYYEYLRGRGLTRGQIRRHDVRKSTSGKYRQRVVFPLRDPRGITVSFYARTIGNREPKGLYPKGKLTISTTLFGWNFFDREIDGAILTEGIFDALKVERIAPRLKRFGVGNPLAVLGGNLSAIQSNYLKPLSEIFILPDGDAGGNTFVERVERRLRHRVKVRVVETPRGLDPDEVDSDALIELLMSARKPRRNVSVKIKYSRK